MNFRNSVIIISGVFFGLMVLGIAALFFIVVPEMNEQERIKAEQFQAKKTCDELKEKIENMVFLYNMNPSINNDEARVMIMNQQEERNRLCPHDKTYYDYSYGN